MQISQIRGIYPKTSFKNNLGYEKNIGRIYGLEQKREELRWGSEGCTGSLNAKDEYELELRKEYQALLNKHAALQWGSEGCTSGLNFEDSQRIREIEAKLVELSQKEEKGEIKPCHDERCTCHAVIPSGNIYGVPDSTFYGDWAR